MVARLLDEMKRIISMLLNYLHRCISKSFFVLCVCYLIHQPWCSVDRRVLEVKPQQAPRSRGGQLSCPQRSCCCFDLPSQSQPRTRGGKLDKTVIMLQQTHAARWLVDPPRRDQWAAAAAGCWPMGAVWQIFGYSFWLLSAGLGGALRWPEWGPGTRSSVYQQPSPGMEQQHPLEVTILAMPHCDPTQRGWRQYLLEQELETKAKWRFAKISQS